MGGCCGIDYSRAVAWEYRDMNDSDLTAFQSSQLQWLRSEVDRAQDDSLRSDPNPNAQNKLFYARNELKSFTSNLRASGKNI